MSNFQFKKAIPPMVTPFKENGDVDYNAFVHNTEKQNDTGLAGYLVLGSSSKTCYLNRQEKEGLMRLTAEHAADDKFVVAGIGLEPIRQTIKLTNRAVSLGAKSVLILTPCFLGSSMDSNALIDYLIQVADHVDIPVLLYNVPKFTRVSIEANATRKLASHPNTLGMKDSSENILQLAAYERVTPDSFNVTVDTAGAWCPALTLGVKAGVHALANCCPDGCVEIQKLLDGGGREEARDLYQKMLPVNSAVTGTYSIARLKYGRDLMGYRGGHVRGPPQSLADERKTALGNIFESAGLL